MYVNIHIVGRLARIGNIEYCDALEFVHSKEDDDDDDWPSFDEEFIQNFKSKEDYFYLLEKLKNIKLKKLKITYHHATQSGDTTQGAPPKVVERWYKSAV